MAQTLTEEMDQAAAHLADPEDWSMWLDNAHHFNCGEAEMLARFFRAWGSPELAESFLGNHGEDDDEGDQHYNYNGMEVPE